MDRRELSHLAQREVVRRPLGKEMSRHLTGAAGGTGHLEDPEQVDVEDVGQVGRTRSEDRAVVAPEHRWKLDLPDEPVHVAGDESRLHQVVTNLLNNARKHTPAGTTVTVSAAVDGPTVSIRVHDDGPGLPDDLAPHAFERFTRGDHSRTRASGGAGLGLSLVAAIVEAHRGRVELNSRPGDTTFSVLLPRT